MRSFWEAGPEVDKPSMAASLPVPGRDVYGTDEMYHGYLDDGDWDLNDVDSTPGGGNSTRAREL